MADRTKRLTKRGLRKLFKEQQSVLKRDPANLVAKLKLAGVLQHLGKTDEALLLYREVARTYHEAGRTVQARSVCKGILELAPGDEEFAKLYDDLAPPPGQTGSYPRIKKRVIPYELQEDMDLLPEDLSPAGPPYGPPVDEEDPDEPTMRRELSARSEPVGDKSSFEKAFQEQAESQEVGQKRDTIMGRSNVLLEELKRKPAAPAGLDHAEKDEGADFDEKTPERRIPQNVLLASLNTGLPSDPPSGKGAAGSRREARPSLAELRSILKPEQSEELNRGSVLNEDEEAAFLELSGGQAVDGVYTDGDSGEILLEEIPLLRDLPAQALEELKTKMVYRKEDANRIIVQQGDPGNAFFFVLSGRVRVEKKVSMSSGTIQLAKLGPGSFFGEFALLSDRMRHASVITDVPSELLEISRKVIGRLAGKYQPVAKTLRRFYRRRLLDTLMRSTPFFHPLSKTELHRLAGRLRFRKFGPGEVILAEGKKGGGFYLILIGEVKVTKGTEGKELARMGEGSYFGEMSLLKNRPVAATISAVMHTEIVELDARDFYKILRDYPQIWEQVNKLARRRELANYALLTGQADRITTPGGGVVI